jgi:hypothetical protein
VFRILESFHGEIEMNKTPLYYRWSDHDKRYGPWIYSYDPRSNYTIFEVILNSSSEEDEVTTFRVSVGPRTLILVMKPWLKGYMKTEQYLSFPAGSPTPVQKTYTEEIERKYGISITGDPGEVKFFQFFWGPQENQWPSNLGMNWSCFLPWTNWRFVRLSFYNLDGVQIQDVFDDAHGSKTRKNCPKLSFEFLDFDGEKIIATTHIEEREWRKGDGFFSWLSLFYKPRIHRSLDIEFSKETGPRKGSWKGGTIGHSIELLPEELHRSAFRRYCEKHGMTFIGICENERIKK